MLVNKPAQMLRDKAAFSVVSLAEADDDQMYWRSKSAHERLQAVEHMRQVIYGYAPATGRLQRIFEVAELAAG
jgi:hypothetical protein